MLLQLGILAEFKVTGSTGNPTGRPAVAQDLAKLAIFQTAQQQAAKTHSAPGNPPSPGLQTFMVILDNFSTGDKYTLKYTRKYDQGPLGKFLGFVRWPEGVQRPVVLSIVADKRDRARIDTYRDFKLDERDAPESAG
jgi:hypothetical protein